MRGPEKELRRRVGFKLTDDRGTMRDALYEVDYCMICHERDKDSCSTGMREKDGEIKRNPLGIKAAGCPLDEKISEMHLLKRQGDSIGSLALVVIDNPMCAGTGHRICNDCMKACIYQKQEPVNIPQAETRTLKDVLELPSGFEIYSLLTRWNPLNIRRPYPAAATGYKVLVAGMGPAGYGLLFSSMAVGGIGSRRTPFQSSTQQIHSFDRQRATPSRRSGPCRQPRLPISRPRPGSATISPVGVTRFCSGTTAPRGRRRPGGR